MPEPVTRLEATTAAMPPPQLQRLPGRILLIEGVAMIVAGLLLPSVNLPFVRIRLEWRAILALGALAVAVAASRRFSAETALMLAAILGISIAGFGMGYRPPARGDITFGITHTKARILVSADSWIECQPRYDPRLGAIGPPNSSCRHFTPEFDVTYRSGPDGFRRLPDPVVSRPNSEIWSLGSSFTFGAGVEDNETYVYRLAAQAWPESRVRSFAIGAYATTNAYIHLQDQLSRGSAPSAVVYAWSEEHRKWNYLRRSAFLQRANFQLIPRFELADGRLRWMGIVPGSQATLEDGSALDETEYKLTEVLIRDMARMCRERHIPFVMLLLSGPDNRVPLAVLDEPGLYELDVRGVSDSYFKHDGHPTRIWHETVAQAIAAHPLLADLTGDPKLLAPAAFPKLSLRAWTLWTSGREPTAVLDTPRNVGEPLRLKILAATKTGAWQVQLKYRTSLRRGHGYLIKLEIRSKEPRSITYAIQQNHAPYENLAQMAEVKLSPEWRTIERRFTVERDEPNAQIVIAAGASKSSIEIRTAGIAEDGRELDASKPALLLLPGAQTAKSQ